jgi:hypothetical protein
MKKIFTLIAASFLTIASFAADRKPVVTLKTSGNYEVVIDGQTYSGRGGTVNLYNIGMGQHTVKVYEIRRSFFMKMRKPVDMEQFSVRRNNVDISINFRGQIQISESRSGSGWEIGQRDRDDNRGGYDNGRGDNHDQGNRDHDQPRRF